MVFVLLSEMYPTKAVSYTHLDVYKRQGRFCLDVSHVHEDSVQNAGIRKDAD